MGRGPGKGNTNNPSGRPKGVPNKATKELREKVASILNSQQNKIEPALAKLEKDNPKAYLDIIEKLLSYVIPKKKDITTDDYPIQSAPITGIEIIRDETKEHTSGETN